MDVVVGIELLALSLVFSRTYSFFPEFRSPLLMGVTFLPLLFVIPALVVRPFAAFITIAIVGIVFGYQFWFAGLWGTPFTGDALGTFPGMFLAAMISVHARNATPSRFLAIFFVATLCYLALYFYLVASIDASAIIREQMQGTGNFASSIRRTHESRGGLMVESEYKIGTSGAVMAFLVLYSLALLLRVRGWVRKLRVLPLVAATVYGLWISDSRFNTLVTAMAAVALLLPIPTRVRAYGGFAIAVAGCVIYASAAFAPYNVFSNLEWDFSGAARSKEFAVANPVLLQTPILGIGIKNSAEDFDAVFTGDVYTADLGYYGEMIQTGVVGLLLLALCHWVIARFAVRAERQGDDPLVPRLVSAYLVYVALIQFLTPQLWAGAGSIMLSLCLAYVGVRTRSARPTPQRERAVVQL